MKEDKMRIAVLDDWQGVAKQSADWSKLQQKADIVFLEEPFAGSDKLVKALGEFDIIIAMREARNPVLPPPRSHWDFCCPPPDSSTGAMPRYARADSREESRQARCWTARRSASSVWARSVPGWRAMALRSACRS